ncbi:branched-chain amino acid ABC transporter permease [Haloarchaeobius sp. HRN-SO-5]|uniref:branched-chain amino acid ABC transporter permease n=1 Tax=Haloarchaeobius sp. HRN-SO-5 TaxID=3446118 RepID=UPI003EBADB15
MSVVGRFIDWTTPEAHSALLGRNGRIGMLVVGIVLAVLAPVGYLVQPFWINIAVRILIFALFALSFDFAFGHGGLASFGHAAMFGTAGYAVAFMLQSVTQNVVVVLSAAVVVGVFVAAVLAWLSARAREIYFAFLTLAFAQMFYVAALRDIPAVVLGVEAITQGDNGIVALPTYELFGMSFGPVLNYYYLTLVLVAVSVVLVLRIANSPFGRVMLSIRENEDRVAFLGYDVRKYKIVGFAISGGFAGLAGGLFVPFQSLVHPNMLFWTMSGDVFLMTLLGGMGTLWGPMVGAAVVILIEDTFTTNWKVVLGTFYVVVVIFAPKGLASLLRSVSREPERAVANVRNALRTYVEKVRS